MESKTQRKSSIKSIKKPNMLRALKITSVGDGMVGKTCMLITYTTKQFPMEYVPTVFDNYADNIILDGREYNMCLWDTAGQEDYERLRPLSYRDTACFLLCFSIGSRSSFENIASKWQPEVQHHCPKIPIVLIGTKADLRQTQNDCITRKEAEKMRKKIGAIKYVECSALKNEGLDAIFVEAVRATMRKPVKNKCFLFQCC